MPADGEVKYLVLADRAVPYLLARVRWPDVAQAVSAASPGWLDDSGLFDLPYNPSAVAVSFTQAASVAAGWGRQLHAEPAEGIPVYLRRMPANWSDLSPSERRNWGIEFVGRRRSPVHRGGRRRPFPAKAAAPAGAQANGHGALAGQQATAGARGGVATERRSGKRVRIGGRAHIRSGGTTISAGLVDLSASGAGCVLPDEPQRVTPGATLGGPFLLEAETSAWRICLDVTGQISWRRSAGADTHFGIAFAELAEGETEGLRRFLAAAQGKGR
jgi:hypothetical protein